MKAKKLKTKSARKKLLAKSQKNEKSFWLLDLVCQPPGRILDNPYVGGPKENRTPVSGMKTRCPASRRWGHKAFSCHNFRHEILRSADERLKKIKSFF